MCTFQYSKFCSKLFYDLLFLSNVICYIHYMMVLTMVSSPNRWYIVKICMCYGWVSITGNTWTFDTSSFNPYSIHIGLPPNGRSNNYNSWNICYGWINHLQCRFTQCGLYQMPWTQYWNSDLRFWIYIKTWSWWHTVCHIMVLQKASNILPFVVGYIIPE